MTGAKNGVACPSTLLATSQATSTRHADLHEEDPAGAQPAEPAPHLRAQVVEVHEATVRSTRSAVSHGRAAAYTASSWAAQRSQCGA